MHLQKSQRKAPVVNPDSTVTAVASFYSTLFLQLPEFGFNGLVSVCAPVFGYLTVIIWKLVMSRLRLGYCAYDTKRYIAELELEKAKPGICPEELQEIESMIRNYRDSMHKRRLEDLNRF